MNKIEAKIAKLLFGTAKKSIGGDGYKLENVYSEQAKAIAKEFKLDNLMSIAEARKLVKDPEKINILTGRSQAVIDKGLVSKDKLLKLIGCYDDWVDKEELLKLIEGE